MNLFDWDKPALKIKNPVRLIELFAGIGAQAKALERLGVPFEHYKVVEIDRFAVASYGMKEQNALGAFIIHGKKVHRRTIGSAGGVQNIEWVRKNLDPNAQEFRSKGKRKYIYVFKENCGRNGKHRHNRTRNEKLIHFDRRLSVFNRIMSVF